MTAKKPFLFWWRTRIEVVRSLFALGGIRAVQIIKLAFLKTLGRQLIDFLRDIYWLQRFPNAEVMFIGVPNPWELSNLHIEIGAKTSGDHIMLITTFWDAPCELSIGSRCQIAKNVCLILSNTHKPGHPVTVSNRGNFISIGNDVWIGYGAIILPDVRVGDGAVIGAGAIVAHDVPPYTVVTNPSAQVRHKIKGY